MLGQQSFTSNDGPWNPLANDNLFNPGGLVVDPESGRLFVADTIRARVLSWPGSEAQAIRGKADLVFGQLDFVGSFYTPTLGIDVLRPTGLALDSQGNLYVAEARLGAVMVFTKPFTNGMPSALRIDSTEDVLNNPVALALDSQDNLYVADTFNHRVLFYEKPLAGNNTTPDRVFGQPDLVSTAPNAGGAISAQSLHYPSSVVLDAADNLYVADSNNHRVLVYLNPLGTDAVADFVIGQGGDFGTGVANKDGISAASLNYPYGLFVDGNGNLYVADMDNNRVLGYTDPLNTDLVADLVLGQDGSFARNQANQGRSISSGTALPGPGTFKAPLSIAVNAEGRIFVTDQGNNRVLSFAGLPSLTEEANLYLPNVTR